MTGPSWEKAGGLWELSCCCREGADWSQSATQRAVGQKLCNLCGSIIGRHIISHKCGLIWPSHPNNSYPGESDQECLSSPYFSHPSPCSLLPPVPQASHFDLFPSAPPADSSHSIASQEIVCLLPCSSILPDCSCCSFVQQVAVFSWNKLNTCWTELGALQHVPWREKPIFCWNGVEKGIPLDVNGEQFLNIYFGTKHIDFLQGCTEPCSWASWIIFFHFFELTWLNCYHFTKAARARQKWYMPVWWCEQSCEEGQACLRHKAQVCLNDSLLGINQKDYAMRAHIYGPKSGTCSCEIEGYEITKWHCPLLHTANETWLDNVDLRCQTQT